MEQWENTDVDDDIPSMVTRLPRQAGTRIQEYLRQHCSVAVSDSWPVTLHSSTQSSKTDRCRGSGSGAPVLCEWGSGFGVVFMEALTPAALRRNANSSKPPRYWLWISIAMCNLLTARS